MGGVSESLKEAFETGEGYVGMKIRKVGEHKQRSLAFLRGDLLTTAEIEDRQATHATRELFPLLLCVPVRPFLASRAGEGLGECLSPMSQYFRHLSLL